MAEIEARVPSKFIETKKQAFMAGYEIGDREKGE